jgi:glycosyltransferase involved in cell wall biosynthesis
MKRPLHICHVFSSFDPGGPELRAVTIMNAMGERATHTVMATNGQYKAAERLNSDVKVQFLQPPAGKGSVFYGMQLLKPLRAVSADLLLTYNWGAIDAVIASAIGRIAPTIHAEDGFGPEEVMALKRRRTVTRRFLLRRIYATVVPSQTLLHITTHQFNVPESKVRFIPNGIDAERFTPAQGRTWRQAAGFRDDELLIGTIGALRAEKNLDVLIRAFGQAKLRGAKLLIAGDGPCGESWRALAASMALSDSVTFVGHLDDPAPYLASLDVFAMSSMTEQMPIALLEAMASGLPAVCTDVGDTRHVIGTNQFPAIVRTGSVEDYASALTTLAGDRSQRCALGVSNRTRAVERFSLTKMLDAYEALYVEAATCRR